MQNFLSNENMNSLDFLQTEERFRFTLSLDLDEQITKILNSSKIVAFTDCPLVYFALIPTYPRFQLGRRYLTCQQEELCKLAKNGSRGVLHVSNNGFEATYCENIAELRMTNSSIENLHQINLLSSLRILILDNIIDINGAFPLLKNLECISELSNIVELRVPNNDLSDISAVNTMKQLTYLDASMNKLKKIHLECYNLKHADFQRNIIECIQQLPAGLSYLDLSENMLHTIYFNQHEMEYLSLSNNYITDIRNLTALKNFSYEWVGIQRRCPKKIDSFTESLQHFQRTYDSYFVEKYTEHTAQQSFCFHDDQLLQDFKFVDDMQSLQRTEKLHQVLIRKCINVCFSRVPTHITELTITQSKVENIYGLHNMVQLVHLDLSHNCLVDVYVIQYLLNLKNLNLSHNRIIFVDPITMLVNLKHLNFSHNRIPQDQLKRNPSLDTSQNNNIFTYQAPLSAEELLLYKRVKAITYISKIQFRSYDTSGNQSHINCLITVLVAQLNKIVSLFMQFAG
ncbi:Conserved_hypothetical protein [Hexamita inflata]|uniref:Uncharacterized protein n=1 Tax=Hexamita inflata TaxID=28002 RepID=A0AA86PNS1_9EUKA|nr:Conserved hypothetical protein [Hexamita inflata]